METSKRLHPNETKSKEEKVQWRFLPDDIWDNVFLNYCDYESIEYSRILQSKYVKHCTKYSDMKSAIIASNLNNMKWIYQGEGVRWSYDYFAEAAGCGDIAIMIWLRQKGCPWNFISTFASAATNGNLSNMM